MRVATIELESKSPYCQSRYHGLAPNKNEEWGPFEERIWKEKGHWDENGQMYIPPFAFKNCLAAAAKYLNVKKKGKGMSTWTKNFESGVLVLEPIVLPETKDKVNFVEIHCDPKGKVGGSSRVLRRFPIVHQWTGIAVVYVTDETIPDAIFSDVVSAGGKFVGLGSFRIANRGIYGGFKVVKITWSEQ